MTTHAAIIGKFDPPHLGHKLMINAARKAFSKVTVYVSDDYERVSTIAQRIQILKAAFPDCLIRQICTLPNEPSSVDEFGTSLDETFLKQWADYLKTNTSQLTHIVSSDKYGKELARLAGVTWIPIDPNREIVKVSATDIRADMRKMWHWLMPETRSMLTRRIAIVGPESVGKSTLANALAKEFNTIAVSEWGRTYSEAKDNILTEQNFQTIFSMSSIIADCAYENANFIAFQDTDAATTNLFKSVYLDDYKDDCELAKILDAKISAYIVLAPTVSFVQDGTRLTEMRRQQMYDKILHNVQASGKPYIEIDDNIYTTRFNKAKEWITNDY